MSDPNTTGLPCGYVTDIRPDLHPITCGRTRGTVKDPRQDRYDVGLCPEHLPMVEAPRGDDPVCDKCRRPVKAAVTIDKDRREHRWWCLECAAELAELSAQRRAG